MFSHLLGDEQRFEEEGVEERGGQHPQPGSQQQRGGEQAGMQEQGAGKQQERIRRAA